jgi:hypothetical protein
MHRTRPARPLLVAVAAVSVTACGSTAVPAQISPDPAATAAAPPSSTTTAGAVMLHDSTPRLMPDGRPACGNVATRAIPQAPHARQRAEPR